MGICPLHCALSRPSIAWIASLDLVTVRPNTLYSRRSWYIRPYRGCEAHGDEEPRKLSRQPKEEARRRKHNAKLIEQLAARGAPFRSHAAGCLDQPFHLRLTRPGCEFDSSITPSEFDWLARHDEALKTRL
ncbi:hypothetical protein GY45DRAFT_958104 [Cubamyces sp. BRFM 1775]|nr:hypothetical protein GY45DRAFT_958104 [Cubamyces sp. BRFM 1775]